MRVTDGGGRFSTGLVVVRVPRDRQNPELNLPATVDLNENDPPELFVFRVEATDDDQLVSYRLFLLNLL